jgi:hypothetical protein
MKTKISAQDVIAVLSEVPGTLLKLSAERDALETRALDAEKELAELRTQLRIDKIASEMIDKQLVENGASIDEIRARLLEKSAAGKLDSVAEAVDMVARGNPLGFVQGNEEMTGTGSAAAAFEAALLGNS